MKNLRSLRGKNCNVVDVQYNRCNVLGRKKIAEVQPASHINSECANSDLAAKNRRLYVRLISASALGFVNPYIDNVPLVLLRCELSAFEV